jgi:hypothetical protein
MGFLSTRVMAGEVRDFEGVRLVKPIRGTARGGRRRLTRRGWIYD